MASRPATPERIDKIAQAKEQLYRRLVREGGLEPLPGARHWTERLALDGWQQAIASSAPRENVDVVLAVIGLASCFQAIVSAEDVTRGKPDPQVFLTAAERLGSAPARSIVVEDAPAGIEAARRAGMPSIGVRRTGAPLAADLAVSSLADLRPDAFNQNSANSGLLEFCILPISVYNYEEGVHSVPQMPRITLHVWVVLTSACNRHGVRTRHYRGIYQG